MRAVVRQFQMRDIAVSDNIGGCGACLRSLRVDVLDLRHKAIRISVDVRQVFPGKISDLGKGSDAVFVAAADSLLYRLNIECNEGAK